MLFLNFNSLPFPVLDTTHLTLRKIINTDAPVIFALRSGQQTMQYIDKEKIASIKVAQEMIQNMNNQYQNNAAIMWGISLKGTAPLIGTIGYWRIEKDHHRAEIGYMLLPDFWNHGYASEAISCVLDFGFDILKLHSIEANINPLNAASRRVLEKQGFRQEGFFKENYYYNGKFLDTELFSLLQIYRPKK